MILYNKKGEFKFMSYFKLMYCDKCGHIWQHPPGVKEICDVCRNSLKEVPDDYLKDDDYFEFINNDKMKQKLINDLVLNSPNFDQYYFDHSDEIHHQQMSENSAILAKGKAILAERSCKPKCPTCGSTNVRNISLISKIVGAKTFGLFSSNVRNTMHCKNCGYKW